MLENLQNSSLVWAILAICSLIGIPSFIFTIYTWYKGNRKKEFSVSQDSYWVIKKGKKKIDKLNLLFDGKEIDDLTITKFVIWNSGNEEIRHDDLVSEKPLAIKSMGKAQILDAEIIVYTESTNKFSITKIESKKATLDFEYVNKNDGVVVQIIHSGSQDELVLDCKLKGGEKIRKHKTENSFLRSIFTKESLHIVINRVMIGIASFYCLLLIRIILAELKILPYSDIHKNEEAGKSASLLVTYILGLIFIIVVYYPMIKRTFKIGIPMKLKKYIR